MAKARIALDGIVEKVWVELDDKNIECKEYQELNRAIFEEEVLDEIETMLKLIVEKGKQDKALPSRPPAATRSPIARRSMSSCMHSAARPRVLRRSSI